MSRHGYNEDCDSTWQYIRWRGAVDRAIHGKRGQAFLLEMFRTLEAMPVKRLIRNSFESKDGEVCALGAVAKARGLDLSKVDDVDGDSLGAMFGIARAMACEIMFMNDDGFWHVTPELRWQRMCVWIIKHLDPVEETRK